MGVSTPSSFAGEELCRCGRSGSSIFVQPALYYRFDRRRVYRGYRHASRREPWSPAKRIFDVIGAGLGMCSSRPPSLRSRSP